MDYFLWVVVQQCLGGEETVHSCISRAKKFFPGIPKKMLHTLYAHYVKQDLWDTHPTADTQWYCY